MEGSLSTTFAANFRHSPRMRTQRRSFRLAQSHAGIIIQNVVLQRLVGLGPVHLRRVHGRTSSISCPVGGIALPRSGSAHQIARSDLAGARPAAPIYLLPFWELSAKSGEPVLTTKCSQQRPRLPSFPPVSATNQPPTSLLGTDANPCTRVRHHIRPLRVEFPVRRARARAPLTHRGFSPPTSSDSTAISPAPASRCGLTGVRRRER